jgi:hypothetical protein
MRRQSGRRVPNMISSQDGTEARLLRADPFLRPPARFSGAVVGGGVTAPPAAAAAAAGCSSTCFSTGSSCFGRSWRAGRPGFLVRGCGGMGAESRRRSAATSRSGSAAFSGGVCGAAGLPGRACPGVERGWVERGGVGTGRRPVDRDRSCCDAATSPCPCPSSAAAGSPDDDPVDGDVSGWDVSGRGVSDRDASGWDASGWDGPDWDAPDWDTSACGVSARDESARDESARDVSEWDVEVCDVPDCDAAEGGEAE